MKFFLAKRDENFKHKEKLTGLIQKMLFIYIAIQPFLDTIYLFDERVINLLGISPSTLIRYLFIIVIAGLTFVTYGFTKKFWFLFGYIAVTGIYFILHCLNASSFKSLYPEVLSFSVVSEAIYIFRFLIPTFIVYIIFSAGVTWKFFERIITVLSSTVSGMIVVTNLLGISLDSYTNNRIKSNIFSWFTGAYKNNSYDGLASKAFFNYANMVSVLLCLLLPIVIYFAFSRKVSYYILVFFHSLSMLMIGTKTATYGLIFILILSALVYIFLFIIKHIKSAGFKKFSVNLGIMLCISVVMLGVILPVSPAIYRNDISTSYMENFDSIENSTDKDEDEEDKEDKDKNNKKPNANKVQNSFEKELQKSGIMSLFYINSYPYKYDKEFWKTMIKEDSTNRLNSRFIEESIFKRLKEINNNPLDNWFGITYSRTSRVYNLERDFLYQYYSLGIIGVIVFLMPYVFVLIYGIIYCLIKFKSLCNLRNICILFGIGIALATAIYCGNTIDAPFANILFSFICSSALIFLKQPENKEI